MIEIILSLISSIIGAIGAIYLKKATNNNIFNKELIIGIILYILGIAIFIPALHFGELSILYPIISLSYVWVALLSKRIFKEEISQKNWFGIILIIVGVFFITL